MARDRRRPTNRHVRRPSRGPIHRAREFEPEGLTSVDAETVDTALGGEAESPSTWLALLMLLSAQTTSVLALVRSLPADQSEQAVALAWTQARDAPDALRELREAAVMLLALTKTLEEITEPVDDPPV